MLPASTRRLSPSPQDPTPFLYDKTMIAMAGFQLLGLGCNLAMRKVNNQHYEALPKPAT